MFLGVYCKICLAIVHVIVTNNAIFTKSPLVFFAVFMIFPSNAYNAKTPNPTNAACVGNALAPLSKAPTASPTFPTTPSMSIFETPELTDSTVFVTASTVNAPVVLYVTPAADAAASKTGGPQPTVASFDLVGIRPVSFHDCKPTSP